MNDQTIAIAPEVRSRSDRVLAGDRMPWLMEPAFLDVMLPDTTLAC